MGTVFDESKWHENENNNKYDKTQTHWYPFNIADRLPEQLRMNRFLCRLLEIKTDTGLKWKKISAAQKNR